MNYAERVKVQLLKDVNFLTKQRLIDYSLLVVIADWENYCTETGNSKALGSNELSAIQSSRDYNYYHIGIIDYLQEWNVNKKVEKVDGLIL